MFIITLAIAAILLLSTAGVAAIRFRQDFIGTWNGHRIHIVVKAISFDLLIDDRLVIENASKKDNTLEHHFLDQGIQQLSITQASNGFSLKIGADAVSLMQAPQNHWGNTVQSQLPEHIPSIVDPRLQSAQNLCRDIKMQLGNDTDISRLLDTMMQKLCKHIDIAVRIEKSEQDYATIGGDQKDIERSKQENETQITQLLEGLQRVHLTVLKRSLSSKESTQKEVLTILAQLETDIEMNQRRL